MITDNKLKTFVTLADCGSFTAAARKLGVSQPAVSQVISILEAECGQALFLRERGSVSLTGQGSLFYGYACRILELYAKLGKAMSGEVPQEEPLVLDLSGGKSAELKLSEGKLEISLNSSNN